MSGSASVKLARTATMLTSQHGHEGCLRLLIAAGANVEHQDKVRDCECGVLSLVWKRLLDYA